MITLRSAFCLVPAVICPQVYRRAYYAAISYQDDNIGQILDELSVLGLKDNTVVIVFGDHGWQLGEHDVWVRRQCIGPSLV